MDSGGRCYWCPLIVVAVGVAQCRAIGGSQYGGVQHLAIGVARMCATPGPLGPVDSGREGAWGVPIVVVVLGARVTVVGGWSANVTTVFKKSRDTYPKIPLKDLLEGFG